MPDTLSARAFSIILLSCTGLCQAEDGTKLKTEAESIAPAEGTVVVANPRASGGKLLQLKDGGASVAYSLNLSAGGYRVRMVGLAESRYSNSVFLVLNEERRQRVFHRVGPGDTPSEG